MGAMPSEAFHREMAEKYQQLAMHTADGYIKLKLMKIAALHDQVACETNDAMIDGHVAGSIAALVRARAKQPFRSRVFTVVRTAWEVVRDLLALFAKETGLAGVPNMPQPEPAVRARIERRRLRRQNTRPSRDHG